MRILGGLIVGTVLGLLCPSLGFIGIFGEIFVNSLKAIAPVLVALLVTGSIATAKGGLGARFNTVIILYLVSTVLASLTAVAGSFLFPITLPLEGTYQGESAASSDDAFFSILGKIVMNPVQSVATANYLGVLFWSILLGMAVKSVAGGKTTSVIKSLADAVTVIVKWIIECAPFGIMGIAFTTVSENGMDIFVTYGKLVALLAGCMLLSCFIINPAIVAVLTRRNPYPLVFRCLKTSGLNAFFTRSSAANIPINMQLCRDLGLEEEFYSVSIPLGATVNMNGAAITINVMTLAMCHTLGVEVSVFSAIMLCFLSTLSAAGTSGVAGGSILLIPLACSFFGIGNDAAMQAVAVAFIIGVIQDSMETALNSSSDVVFTAAAEYFDKDIRRRKKNQKI